MLHAAERRNTRRPAYLEPTAEDGRHSTESAAAEQVRKMRDRHGPAPWLSEDPSDRKGRGEGTGSAHSESLADGKLVLQVDHDPYRTLADQAAHDIARDGEGTPPRAPDLDRRALGGGSPRPRDDPDIEDDPRADRSTTPWIPGLEPRREEPRDVAGREGDRRPRWCRHTHSCDASATYYL